jgi:dTDP-4-dehydrorhamnose reductase
VPHTTRARSGPQITGSRVHYDESFLPDPITPYAAAKAAAETGALLVYPQAVVARTSLIIGGGLSLHERTMHELAAGTRDGVLFTDDIRCPVHVTDLAAAILELASHDAHGIQHLAGGDALSRHELGTLIARRDGLDVSRLPTGLRAGRPRRPPRQPRGAAETAHRPSWRRRFLSASE